MVELGAATKQNNMDASVECAQVTLTPAKGLPGGPKNFDDDRAIVQVDMKDIFVGRRGNWKIPWKKVSQLTFDDSGWFVIDSEEWTVEGFVPAERGLRDTFHRHLDKCWKKQQRKRDRKQQREQEQEEEEHERQMAAAASKRRRFGTTTVGGSSSNVMSYHTSKLLSPSSKRPRPQKTYSKKVNKFAKFLKQNEGVNNWDSDDDDGIFNTRVALDEKRKLKFDDVDDNDGVDESSPSSSSRSSPVEEPPMMDADAMPVTPKDNDVDEDYQHDEVNDDESTSTDPPGHDDGEGLEDEGSEDDDELTTDKSSRRTKKRRLVKQKQRREQEADDESSDDDELFNNDKGSKGTVITTLVTPSRTIVSPETNTPDREKSRRQGNHLLEDSDDDEDDGEQKEEIHDHDALNKGQANISNFFSKKLSSSSPIKNNNEKATKSSSTSVTLGASTDVTMESPSQDDIVTETPGQGEDAFMQTPRQTSPMKVRPTSESTPKPEETGTPAKTSTAVKKKKAYHDFFAPRKTNNNKAEAPTTAGDESPDAATVVPTQTSEGMDDIEEDQSDTTPLTGNITPLQSPKNPQTGLDLAEDPVENTPPRPLEAPNRIPRRLGIKGRTYGKTHSKHNRNDFSTACLALAPNPRALTFETPGNSNKSILERRQQDAPKTPTRTWYWRGLRNLGNTCYMNASLQMLYSVRGLVPSLSSFTASNRPLVNAFCNLRGDLVNRKMMFAANPEKIKRAVDNKTDKFIGYRQRDAHEFLGDLIDQMHEELEEVETSNGKSESDPTQATKTPQPDGNEPKKDVNEGSAAKAESKVDDTSGLPTKRELPTDEQFRLTLQVCLTCKSCGFSRTKDELYRYLSVDIVDGANEEQQSPKIHKRTVENCLEQFFRPEDREIKCEKCEDGIIAEQTLRVVSRPKALLLHLKRFVLVQRPIQTENGDENASPNKSAPAVEMTFQKNKAPVVLSEKLSLDKYYAAAVDNNARNTSKFSSQQSYSIQSIVHHIGNTANSGHYTADAKRTMANGSTGQKWISFDDGIAAEAGKTGHVVSSIQKQKTAYMVLYTLD